jgi:hypothetical protein
VSLCLISENRNPRRFHSSDLPKIGSVDKLPTIKKKEIEVQDIPPPPKAKKLSKVVEEEKKEEPVELRRSTRERKAKVYNPNEWTK